MSIDDEFDRGFLARYFAGGCTREETQRFERWTAHHPERQVLVGQLRDAWQAFGDMEQEAFDTTAAWAKLDDQIRVEPRANPPLRLVIPRESTARRIARRLAIAASLMLTIGVGSWLAQRNRGVAGPMREITSRPGQRADVYLSDGTHVILGAASRLRFASPLGKASRDIYLEGEALFEVKHDAKSPFFVRTAHAVTEDLGTKFSVRAYAADSLVTVAVAEGKVALRRDSEAGTILGAGDLGTMTARGQLATHRGAALDPYLAWADGQLVFANARLRDVLPQLARWYDLDVRTTGLSPDTLFLSATFTTESTDDMLRNVALTFGIRYERHGRKVTFHAR